MKRSNIHRTQSGIYAQASECNDARATLPAFKSQSTAPCSQQVAAMRRPPSAPNTSAASTLVFLALALAGFFALPLAGRAQNTAALFDEANKLYEQAKYQEAATAYEKLLQSDPASAALYFNLGNAWFKAGQSGRAIAAYRQAERLAPRDPDLRFNLNFVRKKVSGSDFAPGCCKIRCIMFL